MKTPKYLTRYYTEGEDPFTSLTMLDPMTAAKVKKQHCERNNIGGFYAEDSYIPNRLKIEKWMYCELIRKGGNPRNRSPVYMALGESPQGEYDIRADIQRDAKEIVIDIASIDLSAVTFTYPDSMYELVFDENQKVIGGKRTNTPKIYLYGELEELIDRFNIYEEPYEHYIEAQVWNTDMLRSLITD